MALGSILTRPDSLESSLNYRQLMSSPFPKDKTLDQSEAVRRFVRCEISKSTGGKLKALIPFSLIASAGAELGADTSTSLENIMEASQVRAVAIMPDEAQEFVEEALQTPKVKQYVRGGAFGKPLYMIVGVATCRALRLGSASSREGSLSLDLDASLTVSGVEAGVGASIERKKSAELDIEVDEECDFAYRVREFQYSKLRKQITKSRDMTKGAFFDGREVSGEEAFEMVPVFEFFEDADEDWAA